MRLALQVALRVASVHPHYHPAVCAVYADCAVCETLCEYDGPFLFYANIFL